MHYIVAFARFWYDFIVGDDWTTAAGVVAALIITALLADGDIAAWWVMPLAVALLLAESAWRATHPAAK